MTKEQREKINEAFDILCDVYKDLGSERGVKREAQRLDTILGKIEDLLWLRIN